MNATHLLIGTLLGGLPLIGATQIEAGDAWRTDLALTADYVATLDGGRRESDVLLGNLDMSVAVETESAGLWANGEFFIYVLGNANDGQNAGDIVGDVQATSNIDTDEAIKVYEAWYAHRFRGDALNVLLGLHDYNSEFDVLEHAGLFIHSSFGISPDISQVGPSIFATTALGLRMRVADASGSYLLAAIYDGVPGNPDTPRGTHIDFDDGDGVFAAAEWGHAQGEVGERGSFKVALGGWYHTAEIEDVAGETDDRNAGGYMIGEFAATDRLAVFVQAGGADDTRNRIAWYLGGGVTLQDALPIDRVNTLGLAVGHAVNGTAFRDANPGAERAETAIELTWALELCTHLTLQPDLQYIVNPGDEPGLDDAIVASLRTVAVF